MQRYRIDTGNAAADIWEPGQVHHDLRTEMSVLDEIAGQFAQTQKCDTRIVKVALLTSEHVVEVVRVFDSAAEPAAEL